MRTVRRVLVAVLLVALGYGVAIAQGIVVRPALVVGQDAVSSDATRDVTVTVEDIGGRVLHVHASGTPRLTVVFYPGGYVRPQAYEWLGRALAVNGFETFIPEMPLDLAVLGKDRADAVIATLPADRKVVLAGHSLGGVMAADYASRHADRVGGLLLMAAYPADGVRVSASWPALSLAAEHDGLASFAEVDAGMSALPEGSVVYTVSGAVHSFFGRYGPQAGDGVPTVSRSDAEAQILDAVRTYLSKLG